MITIGICGVAGAGKTTAGKMLKAMRKKSTVIHFGDALKWEVAKAMGISIAELEKRKEEFRPVLQIWGTELRRKQNPKYWIDMMEVPYAVLEYKERSLFIIPDVRFENEAQWIEEKGGFLIRIHPRDRQCIARARVPRKGNPKPVKLRPLLEWAERHHTGHISEQWVRSESCKPDFEIRNDESKSKLRSELKKALRAWENSPSETIKLNSPRTISKKVHAAGKQTPAEKKSTSMRSKAGKSR